jgi:hypothetical protein
MRSYSFQNVITCFEIKYSERSRRCSCEGKLQVMGRPHLTEGPLESVRLNGLWQKELWSLQHSILRTAILSSK